jgi:hypothetical protein
MSDVVSVADNILNGKATGIIAESFKERTELLDIVDIFKDATNILSRVDSPIALYKDKPIVMTNKYFDDIESVKEYVKTLECVILYQLISDKISNRLCLRHCEVRKEFNTVTI